MPTFPIVHEQIKALLSAGKATSIKPTEWFTDTMQAEQKKEKKNMSYTLRIHNRRPVGSVGWVSDYRAEGQGL